MNLKFTYLFALVIFATSQLKSQTYWQQKVDYTINVEFEPKKHQYSGEEKLVYTNNSPDTLNRLFFHLYPNAFQPNSMMDERSRVISDPDKRVGDRIFNLKPNEYGFLKVKSLKLNGKKQETLEVGTILEVKIDKVILPGTTVTIEVEFEGQSPVQIRRSGRDNAEGVDYSVSQWYPKLCEYDVQGWHANPYIAREFYGVWGNFDVTIEIDGSYVVAATGVLQNPNEIGYGYSDKEIIHKSGKKIKWHFKAENVHDFVWAADTEYKHTTLTRKDGTILHFFYIPGPKTTENWEKFPKIIDEAFNWINKRYGQYPYPVYSFIQGGDGGMEYAMATLITGERPLASLVGVAVHELMHSWYQMVLGTNESLYSWMDEGFTSFASTETMDYLKSKSLIPGKRDSFLFKSTINGFANFQKSGYEEPLTVHSDHFSTNAAFSVGSYTKGQLALVQLDYIVGTKVFDKSLLDYFNKWKFKHPTPNDFIRVFEKNSNLELDWFKEYWVNTTHTIDYAIDSLDDDKNLMLVNKSKMPMPIDLIVTLKNGKKHLYYIPQSIMRGEKEPDLKYDMYTIANDWDWTHQKYTLKLKESKKDIKSIEIDPSYRMVDSNRSNNILDIN